MQSHGQKRTPEGQLPCLAELIVAKPRFRLDRACIVMLHNMSPVFNVGTTPHASNSPGR